MDKGDQSFLDLLSPNYVVHFTGGMDVHGPEKIKNLVEVFKKALPDFRHVFKDFIAEGNKVSLRYSGIGTHMHEFTGIQPSQVEVNITAIGIFQIENGKMIEGWIECDMITPLKNALAESEKSTQ
jgi:predicted ester cyclase